MSAETAHSVGVNVLCSAILNRAISAKVVVVDHYRSHGIMVETDYIIQVEGRDLSGLTTNGAKYGENTDMAPSSMLTASSSSIQRPHQHHDQSHSDERIFKYMISKTYHQFRTLAHDLRACVLPHKGHKGKAGDVGNNSSSANNDFCQKVSDLIDSEHVRRFGKMNFHHVKNSSTQRSALINTVLEFLTQEFPQSHQLVRNTCSESSADDVLVKLRDVMENFFVTDHVIDESVMREASPLVSQRKSDSSCAQTSEQHEEHGGHHTVKQAGRRASSVLAKSTKLRRSYQARKADEALLTELGRNSTLMLQDDSREGAVDNMNKITSDYYSGYLSKFSATFSPMISSFGITLFVGWTLHRLSHLSLQLQYDCALLMCFACFCVGRWDKSAREGDSTGAVVRVASGKNRQRQVTISPAVLERAVEKAGRSHSVMVAKTMRNSIAEDILDVQLINSPLEHFKTDGDENCWSEPGAGNFRVRGATYLEDKVKKHSDPFLFSLRGVDLFLTDDSPENIGRSPHLLGGDLRNVPTFIVNFRLPWGSLVLYFQIPSNILSFLDMNSDGISVFSSIEKMSGSELSLCRFFAGSNQHRNGTLKIIPAVVEGPLIIRSALRGKPVIIGNKLPVSYAYQPAERKSGKAMYFEVDLDIAALSRARRILSVCRSYAHGLTIDVAFVIQGNHSDELPEQLLCGTRLHRIDLLHASSLPQISDNESETL